MIALIEDQAVIQRIMRHRGLPTDLPEARPARAPPAHLLLDSAVTQVTDEIDPA